MPLYVWLASGGGLVWLLCLGAGLAWCVRRRRGSAAWREVERGGSTAPQRRGGGGKAGGKAGGGGRRGGGGSGRASRASGFSLAWNGRVSNAGGRASTAGGRTSNGPFGNSPRGGSGGAAGERANGEIIHTEFENFMRRASQGPDAGANGGGAHGPDFDVRTSCDDDDERSFSAAPRTAKGLGGYRDAIMHYASTRGSIDGGTDARGSGSGGGGGGGDGGGGGGACAALAPAPQPQRTGSSLRKTLSKFRAAPARTARQESASDAARRAEAQRAAVKRGSLGIATQPTGAPAPAGAFPTPPDALPSPRGGGFNFPAPPSDRPRPVSNAATHHRPACRSNAHRAACNSAASQLPAPPALSPGAILAGEHRPSVERRGSPGCAPRYCGCADLPETSQPSQPRLIGADSDVPPNLCGKPSKRGSASRLSARELVKRGSVEGASPGSAKSRRYGSNTSLGSGLGLSETSETSAYRERHPSCYQTLI